MRLTIALALQVEKKRDRQVRVAASRSKSATPETTVPVRGGDHDPGHDAGHDPNDDPEDDSRNDRIIMILVMTIIQVRQPKKMFTCQTCSKAFHSNFVLKVGHSGGAFVMLLAPLLPAVSLVAPDPGPGAPARPQEGGGQP